MKLFTFEKIGGDYERLAQDIRRGTPTAVFGVSDPLKYLLASMIDVPVLYVTADALSAKKAADNVATLSGKQTATLCAKDEVFLYRKALSKDAFFRRLNGIHALKNGCPFVAAEIDALLQLFPKNLPVLTFEEGKEVEFSNLAAVLVELGYVRDFEVQNKGTFAVRGDILDIFPINAENPVRIDFFGDEVEKIKPYDSVTGERLETVSKLSVLAATDAFLSPEDGSRIETALKSGVKALKTAESVRRAQEIVSELLAQEDGVSQFLLPLLNNSTSVFEILPKNTVVVFDEAKSVWDKMNGLYQEAEARFSRLIEGGEVLSFSLGQMIDKERFLSGFDGVYKLSLQSFTGNPFFFNPLQTYHLTATPTAKYLNALPALLTDLRNWMKGDYRVFLFCGDSSRAQKMQEALTEEYLPHYGGSDFDDETSPKRGIFVFAETLDKGFVLHSCKTSVIGTGDLYTKIPAARRIKRKRGDLFVAPEIGDYAVHETHGIGKVIGTKKIETTDGVKECVAIAYRDGDTLYLPVESMDSLSKYVGEETPKLSKIGGAEFERVKARVRAAIKTLAFDLKKLYSERSQHRGYEFPKNEPFMQEFEQAFPYELTPDQASSVEEIKADMCSEKVMDRLLCGDVGFGKTEVAFRAAYLCILAGKQAAIMCPSTVLCTQHYHTATERFAPFGVRVAALSRFSTPKQQAEILKGLADGKIDLVVGTHRLLSADIHFKDLGLLVLDEEQRFGVEHKEKIKNLRRDIDCLTMTATPIPRTLHMSLSGMRDISTIQTPPQERLPVQTYVVEETETLLRDACLRELSRGGQVFVLYNRVESIYTFAARLKEILPEARISVAHGRMEKAALENTVLDFYAGKSDVLVATTIIENGVDMPNANTLIAIDSDRLGISQLYQLKGRVGRSSRLAYAYFTYKAEKVMSKNAEDRLKAIMEFTELGAGYKLAMRDLEIRGAGNVLGVEQHGHMDKIGYELYSKLLKEELTGEVQSVAELDVQTSAYIPEDYVESSSGRLDTYKQIAEISSVSDYKRVYTSLVETYGSIPKPVGNLLVIAVLKSYAAKFGVKKITVKDGYGALELPSISTLADKRLQAALDKYANRVRLNMAVVPTIEFGGCGGAALMAEMTKFLKFALTFTSL